MLSVSVCMYIYICIRFVDLFVQLLCVHMLYTYIGREKVGYQLVHARQRRGFCFYAAPRSKLHGGSLAWLEFPMLRTAASFEGWPAS